MSCPKKYLLKTHVKASPINGNVIRRTVNAPSYDFVCKNIPNKIAPKNVLPTSPINILAGLQFKIRKPIKAPAKGDISWFNLKEKNNNAKDKQPATKPSEPSMKLMKLIMAVPKNIKKVKVNKFRCIEGNILKIRQITVAN